jgi:hypothetical protein
MRGARKPNKIMWVSWDLDQLDLRSTWSLSRGGRGLADWPHLSAARGKEKIGRGRRDVTRFLCCAWLGPLALAWSD